MSNQSDIIKEREEKLAELKQKGQEFETQRKAKQAGLPYLDLSLVPIDRDNLNLIPREEAERAQIVVIRRNKKNLKVGVVEPANEEVKQIIERLKKQGFKIDIFIISPPFLKKTLKEYEKIPVQFKKRKVSGQVDLGNLAEEKAKIKTFSALKKELQTPTKETSELLELILASALILEASDIHIEPEEKQIMIRLRLDGILQEAGTVSLEAYQLMLSRIKLVSGIQINIKDTPQDGRFTVKTSEYEAETRVSVLPGAYGEYIVIRVLNPKAVKLTVADLGLRDELWRIIKEEIERPNGIVLVTGPTGSGKTTTLYAFLKHLLKPAVNIITLEDPIEYHIKGISQSQIEPEKGYTFSKGLRSSLRQDPDIILVGEIRDEETAQTALNAALTGHFVFSTLHTNDAPGAVPRFLDLNAKPKILANALNAVIAQRLVRKLCPECKKPKKISGGELKKIKNELAQEDQLKNKKEIIIYEAVGCNQCSQTGYRGRIGIFEVMRISKKMEELIGKAPSHQEVLTMAKKEGFLSMYQDGLIRVVEGITTTQEVERVAQALE